MVHGFNRVLCALFIGISHKCTTYKKKERNIIIGRNAMRCNTSHIGYIIPSLIILSLFHNSKLVDSVSITCLQPFPTNVDKLLWCFNDYDSSQTKKKKRKVLTIRRPYLHTAAVGYMSSHSYPNQSFVPSASSTWAIAFHITFIDYTFSLLWEVLPIFIMGSSLLVEPMILHHNKPSFSPAAAKIKDGVTPSADFATGTL